MKLRWMVLLALVLAGCAPKQTTAAPNEPASTRTASSAGELTPFYTYTPRPPATATNPATPTPLPSPTSTPRTHSVVRGEDMGGIAFRYGISLEALMAANPAVSPAAMSIGTVLIVPAGAAAPTGQPPTPGPLGVSLGVVECFSTAEDGAVCFVAVTNEQDQAVENVSVVVRMAGDDGRLLSRSASTPLNRLPAATTTALSIYFPPPAPPPFQASAELLTALPLQPNSARYLDARLEDVNITPSADKRSAQIKANVTLVGGDSAAAQVWIAAVAYTEEGRVTGLRRWENVSPLQPGERLSLDFSVYSAGGPIERVDLLVEARP